MTTATFLQTAKLLLTGREYLRVSQDRSGRMKSPGQQHEENQASADRHGITLLEPYAENKAVSASRYSTDTRDGFERLISDLRTDRFGADVLILWESSRGSRRVGEWVTMLDLLEDHGKLVHVTTHGRTYDPANPRDRRTLLEDAVDSEFESAKTRGRIKRDMKASAAAGRPHGVCPFGYLPVYFSDRRGLDTWKPDPARAPIIFELFDRLRKGHSFRSIAKDFEARGITNRKGEPFTQQHLRDMVKKAVYAGYRAYLPKELKGTKGAKPELIEGTWEAIVPRDLFWDVQRILSEPKHQNKAPRPGRVLHEYTTTVRCDVCEGPIGVVNSTKSGEPEYKCQINSCVRTLKAGIDEIITNAILAYLARPDVYEILTARSESAEAETAQAELAKLRAELDEAQSTTPATVAEARMFARLVEDLTAKVADAERWVRELTAPGDLIALIEPGADAVKHWKAAPVSARRKAAAILLTPEHLGEVRITRSPVPRRRVPAEERIVWRRAE
ncbi:recombinase family protein [Streptosporangium algeriense]|uniref:Recombinase family protein n=1 Tax=Streptosporangium algeriense TaxID=1682748 RepID=A0ABW3DK76_9ACTN